MKILKINELIFATKCLLVANSECVCDLPRDQQTFGGKICNTMKLLYRFPDYLQNQPATKATVVCGRQ